MSFFDDASLVTIPSGYKDGTLYSVKPIDGTGDLTFSRGSDIEATRVASNGYIEKADVNLLTYSNTFSNAAWSKVNVTATGGQAGYDGSNDAWLIEGTGSSVFSYLLQSDSTASVKTRSVYAKAGTVPYLGIWGAGSNLGYFDLSDGSLDSISGTFAITHSITSVGGGWYRCEFTTTGSAANVYLVPSSTANGTILSAGENIYIQDAQLNYGLVAQEYQETTTTSVVAGITNDMPRLDYSGGASCPSLLLEGSRTNIIESSEFINGAGWSSSGTPVITQNYGISPEGVINSVLVNDDSSGGFEAVTNSMSLTSGTTYTGSFYIKKATSAVSHYAGFTIGGFPYIIINTYDGTTNTTGGTGSWSSIKMETFNENWWRFSATMTATASGTASFSVWPAISSNGTSIDSSATGTQEFYGFQCEAGSHSTSLIPTYGASATRTADACSKTGISSLIGQTEGTLFVEGVVDGVNASVNRRIFSISDGTTSNAINIQTPATNAKIEFEVTNGGTTQALISAANNSLVYGQKFKAAFAYKANDFVAYINGVQIGTDTSGTVPSCGKVSFDRGNGTSAFEGATSQALLFKTRLSNSDLAALTS